MPAINFGMKQQLSFADNILTQTPAQEIGNDKSMASNNSALHLAPFFSRLSTEIGKNPASDLNMWYLLLFPLLLAAISGNLLVIMAVFLDKKLRNGATNKFIASLAVSDLLVGALVMPFALYIKMNNDEWDLSEGWCKFHLCSTAFSTTASILHLIAISLDRYFAIVFPTEYQRHLSRTRSLPYLIMIWVISLLMSVTLFLEPTTNNHKICWIEDPQYLLLSTLISFISPAFVICLLYTKIFRKLRRHLSIFWALKNRIVRKRTPPAVIVEEIRSRRGSRVSVGANSQGSTGSRTRSVSQPDIVGNNEVEFRARFRSPTICGETLQMSKSYEHTPAMLEPPEPPSRRISIASTVVAFHRRPKSPKFHVNSNLSQSAPSPAGLVIANNVGSQLLTVPNSDIYAEKSANTVETSRPNTSLLSPPDNTSTAISLAVPKRLEACRAAGASRPSCTSVSTGSSVTTGSSDDKKSSVLSFGSSISDDIENLGSPSLPSSRRVSSLTNSGSMDDDCDHNDTHSSSSRRSFASTGGKLRKIAAQVTRAIRHKRRESAAIRHETRATRVVAAILIVFILCWLPYFCASVYRGICIGLGCNLDFSTQIPIYLVTSWLGYAHSVFNPFIYAALNKNFRSIFTRILGCNSQAGIQCNTWLRRYFVGN